MRKPHTMMVFMEISDTIHPLKAPFSIQSLINACGCIKPLEAILQPAILNP